MIHSWHVDDVGGGNRNLWEPLFLLHYSSFCISERVGRVCFFSADPVCWRCKENLCLRRTSWFFELFLIPGLKSWTPVRWRSEAVWIPLDPCNTFNQPACPPPAKPTGIRPTKQTLECAQVPGDDRHWKRAHWVCWKCSRKLIELFWTPTTHQVGHLRWRPKVHLGRRSHQPPEIIPTSATDQRNQ